MKLHRFAWPVCCAALIVPVTLATAPASTSPAAASAPADTQPAAQRVLVRFGGGEQITQADFEAHARGLPARRHDEVILVLTRQKLFQLYLRDHPELVPAEKLEAAIDQAVESSHLKGREQLADRLKAQGITWERMRVQMLMGLGEGVLNRRGSEPAEDPVYLRQRFDRDPSEFDGTSVAIRHILIGVMPYDTPAQKQAKRERLAKIRAELLSGRLKWDDAVWQSDCPSRFNGGKLGISTRHLMFAEPLAKAALALPVGQLSEIVESEFGFHLLEVTERTPGQRPFDHRDTQRDMRQWLEQEPMWLAMAEARQRHPIIGVAPPIRSALLAASEPAAATQPAAKPALPATLPAK